jgi:hypothetical protein
MNNLLPWIAMSLACGVLALVGFYLRHRERVRTQEEMKKRPLLTGWWASGASARRAVNISTQEQTVGGQEEQSPSRFGHYKN